ncbi:MAG TPA: hypothetical protein VMW91_03080 [Desulfosporosinus sp.]|nr:hypothetical protein [Desulfosporosinus sp.]
MGQTRAQVVSMQEGRVPGKSDILVRLPAEHVLCSAPLMKAPLEPSLASHSIREVRLCKREVLGWELRERWNATRDSSYLHNMQVRTAPSPSLVSVPVALIYVYSAFLAIK